VQTGGREAFSHYLLTLDIGGFNVRRVPQTEALHDQKLLSLPTVEGWFYGSSEGRHGFGAMNFRRSTSVADFSTSR
jgi:hypothetical protein